MFRMCRVGTWTDMPCTAPAPAPRPLDERIRDGAEPFDLEACLLINASRIAWLLSRPTPRPGTLDFRMALVSLCSRLGVLPVLELPYV